MGEFTGGELVVEGDRTIGGPGSRGRWQYFHGSQYHYNRPHTGDRWAVVAYAKWRATAVAEDAVSPSAPREPPPELAGVARIAIPQWKALPWRILGSATARSALAAPQPKAPLVA